MRRRGLPLLEAHIRSFDPGAPTARERLAAALGEPFTRQLLQGLLPSAEEWSPTGLVFVPGGSYQSVGS